MVKRRLGPGSSFAIAFGLLAAGCSGSADGPGSTTSAPLGASESDALPETASPTSSSPAAPTFLESSLLRDLQLAPTKPAPWTHAHGGQGDDGATAIARSGSNLIVAGWLGASGDVGCGLHTMPSYGGYVAAYGTDGSCLWASYFDGADWASAVTSDPNGAIYVTGTFAGTASFAGDVRTSNAASTDVFVAKLDSSGVIQWVKTIGGADEDYAYAIAARSDRVAIGGSYGDAMTVGASLLASSGGGDGFVIELASGTGAVAATHTFGGPGWDSVDALAYAPDGALAVGGSFADTVDFGLGPVVSAGGQDAVLIVYEPSTGAPRAVRRIGGPSTDAVHALTYDASGEVVAAGYFGGSADVNGATSLVGEGEYTGFVTTWTSALALDQVLTLPASTTLLPYALDPLAGGGFVVAGSFTGTARFGATTLASTGPAKSAFVAMYTGPSGWTWAESTGTGAEAMGVKVSDTGAVVAVGAFEGTLGSTPVSSAGGTDAFVATFAP